MNPIFRAIVATFATVSVAACCDVESTCAEIADGTDRSEAYDSFCNDIELDITAFSTEFIGPDGDSCRCSSDGSTVSDCHYVN